MRSLHYNSEHQILFFSNVLSVQLSRIPEHLIALNAWSKFLKTWQQNSSRTKEPTDLEFSGEFSITPPNKFCGQNCRIHLLCMTIRQKCLIKCDLCSSRGRFSSESRWLLLYFHARSFYHLRRFIRYHRTPETHTHKLTPACTPVNRLWCVKQVDFPKHTPAK